MKEITQEENKKILIEMMQEIHDYCEKNNLRYSLAYGTLLGCIRHKGFIPWDDDIDIMMPRRDFDLFAANFNQASNKLKLLCLNNSPEYNLLAAKVINTDTLLIEDVESPIELGVYVDVFITDYLPENERRRNRTLRKLKRLRREYVLKTVKIRKGRAFCKNAVLFFAHIFLKPISTHSIISKMDRISREASPAETDKCGALASFAYEKKEIMKSEWFNQYELGVFEERKFYIPVAYDKILTNLYGDYMTPPPKELQESHHVNKAYWRE